MEYPKYPLFTQRFSNMVSCKSTTLNIFYWAYDTSSVTIKWTWQCLSSINISTGTSPCDPSGFWQQTSFLLYTTLRRFFQFRDEKNHFEFKFIRCFSFSEQNFFSISTMISTHRKKIRKILSSFDYLFEMLNNVHVKSCRFLTGQIEYDVWNLSNFNFFGNGWTNRQLFRILNGLKLSNRSFVLSELFQCIMSFPLR